MLGHGQENAAAGRDRLAHLGKDLFILGNMFQHIKGPQDIEFGLEGNRQGIHLVKGGPFQPLAGVNKTLFKHFASRHLDPRKAVLESRKDETVATANLKKTSRKWKILLKS